MRGRTWPASARAIVRVLPDMPWRCSHARRNFFENLSALKQPKFKQVHAALPGVRQNPT